MRAEREDVLIPSQGVIDGQIFDIRRIVELALSFNIDQVRIVLFETCQATLTRIHDMAPPTGIPQTVALLADKDAAVNDRNQIGICNVIQDVAWPRTIDTAEEDVAVESLTETFFFGNGERIFFETGFAAVALFLRARAIISTFSRFA